jgi:hypothetical protein
MNRVEQALRRELAKRYGFDVSAYRCHLETMDEGTEWMSRYVTFYRPDTGASIQIDNILTDRGGWPAQYSRPELSQLSSTILRQYLKEDGS